VVEAAAVKAADNAKTEILARIGAALPGEGGTPVRPPDPAAVRAGDPDLLAARVEDYAAGVIRVASESQIPTVVGSLLADQGAARVVVPAGLPPTWLPPGVETIIDRGTLAAGELAQIDASLTGSAMAIAETGTIVLDGGPTQGRRALTLLPDLHLCVVRAATVVADVRDAIDSLRALGSSRRPITFVSGPSATSDIELERVEGVHGPRRLEVLLID
jgi:L-lactate dehydrogenase complex protein LldG